MTDQRQQPDKPRHAVKRSAEPDTKRDRGRDDEPLSAAQARRVIDRVVVAEDQPETPPAQDATALLLRRAIYVFAALIALGVIVFAALAIYTLSTGATVAELASTGAVGANRERAASDVLGTPGQDCAPTRPESVTFECLNRDRAALGLVPVVPLAGLAPSQLGAVLGEERAELRRVRAERGEGARDGVSTPEQGRFRGAR